MSNKTKQGAQNIMGMAASQARLLSITSRLSDNEFNAQGILRTKMQNSKETDKLSEDYRRSLDLTKMVGEAYTDKGLQRLDLSYNLVAGDPNMPLQTQYAVTNAQGQLIIPKTTGIKYNSAIEGLDLTTDEGYGKAFDKFITSMGIKKEPIPKEPDMPPCMTDPDGEYQQYDNASKAWGEANQENIQAVKDLNKVKGEVSPEKIKFTAKESAESKYEILLSDPIREAKIMAFAKLGTTFPSADKISGKVVTLTVGTRTITHKVPDMIKEFNVYKWDSNLTDRDNLKLYLTEVLKSIVTNPGLKNSYQDAISNGTGYGEWGNTASDPAINNFFNPDDITIPIFDEDGVDISNKYTKLELDDGYVYDEEDRTKYNAAQALVTTTGNTLKTKKTDLDKATEQWLGVAQGENGEWVGQKIDKENAGSVKYKVAIDLYNKENSEYLDKYEDYCRDKYSIYSNPKQAKYYEQLFIQIVTRGAIPVEDDKLNDNTWFQHALKTGQIFLEKHRADGTWESCHWKTEPGMTEVNDDKKAGQIKTKYELDIDKLQRKEDALDMQLKSIETEHSALQTEFDGVKSVIQKNIERSFKTLG